MTTELTVAICMYNAEKYIVDTLRCISEQTMQNFYILIVDDCSTDNSVEKVQNYFKDCPHSYCLKRLEQNGGIANARNLALNEAKTKYLIFIDSDDFPLPTLLEREYSLLSTDAQLIGVSSWLTFVDVNGKKIGGGHYLGDKSKELFKQRAERNKLIFLPIQTMFDRECAIRVGGFCCDGFPDGKPRYRDFCEDLDLWTRMSDLYVEEKYIVSIPEVLYHYRKTDGLSANHFNMIVKMRYVKKNLLLRRNDEKELTFTEFMSQMSPKELSDLKRDSQAADALRNGVFYLKQGKVLKGVVTIAESIWCKPSYIFDKIKHNFRIK